MMPTTMERSIPAATARIVLAALGQRSRLGVAPWNHLKFTFGAEVTGVGEGDLGSRLRRRCSC